MRAYENPQYLHENKLTQRAYYIPKNEDAYTSLNGIWDFAYFSHDYDEECASSGTIDVPSCWQCRGFENPNYSNSAYPYPVDAPFVPNDNPMGVYSRTFQIKDLSRKYYVVFEGVSSCLELFINDTFAGFSTGSRLQAEFDITELIKESNRVKTAVTDIKSMAVRQ